MKIFGTNRTDNKKAFYRIIQPLRMLKRSGWDATMIPFTGIEEISTLPVHDQLLVRLSEKTDFILTSLVMDEEELLRIINLRKKNNCRWVMDMSENVYANLAYEPYMSVIEKSIQLADGLIITPQLKGIYTHEYIYELPSLIDFEMWGLKSKVSRKIKIGYYGEKEDLELVSPALQEIVKNYDVKFVNLGIRGIIDLPKTISKLGLKMALFPLADTDINRYKDNISLLECLALKIPVIASPTYNLDVLCADSNFEWYESIENLLKNSKKRKEVAENGYKLVEKEFNMTKYPSKLQTWLKKLPKKKY